MIFNKILKINRLSKLGKSFSYYVNKNSLTTPWTESPFFSKLIENNYHTNEQKQICTQFFEKGYVIIDLNLKNKDYLNINNDVNDINKKKLGKIQAEHFQYNKYPRLFEGWKQSKNIRKLAVNNKILDTLKLLYNKTPIPFSTINFIKGSNQPLHSDCIHFNTIPFKWMSGVWVALEDTNKYNGTLRVIPGSHKWDIYDYNCLQFENIDLIENGEKINYRKYEKFIEMLIESKKAEETIIELKKGQALIWAANLLHGGIPIYDKNLTRKTQVTHYFYNNCDKYYHPMFSKPLKGIYAEKWCDENNNILTWNN